MTEAPFFHVGLATILNLVSTLAIVGALIFTALQVRQGNRSQRDQAAFAMIETVLRDTLTESRELIGDRPVNAQLADIEKSGAATKRALLEFGVGLESRVHTDNPRFFEWCEWLAERIGDRRRTRRGHIPAHTEHAIWRE